MLQELRSFDPIHSYHFGHTPFQVEHFQTSNQKGCPEFEYLQHVLQLKALYNALEEIAIELKEIQYSIKKNSSLWPPWGFQDRFIKVPRLRLREKALLNGRAQKEREAKAHLEIINNKFHHLVGTTEDQLWERADKDYWTTRLSRQLLCSNLARILGVGEGVLEAVVALPESQQRDIIRAFKEKQGQLQASLQKPQLGPNKEE